MIGLIPRSIDPPDLPLCSFCGKLVEHRHHRGCTDACAEQDKRALAGLQSEASSWCAYFEEITLPHTSGQKRTPDTMGFALHADTEVSGRRQVRQRIAPNHRWFCVIHLQPQDDKLT